MKKSEKEYLKHFAISALLVIINIMLPNCDLIPCWLKQTILAVTFIYILLFFVGFLLNIGPFKYIGKLYVQDRKQEHEERRAKKPWE
jgi:hypothetical protein